MRSVTGIELGAESCVLVRVRPDHGPARLSAVHGLEPEDRAGPHDIPTDLRRVRRSKRFPRRARVVAWGLHASASATDAATLAALGPLREAGFIIDDVMTPPQALAALARQRPRPAGRGAAAWLAINRHGAAIAIVDRGELLYAREFDWHYRPVASSRAELLQRYSLVAHLAPELRHGLDVVRRERGSAVDTVITCGDLPELRSLTMPLIEELDMEVETLDSLDGLRPARPGIVNEIGDRAPAIRLACAAGAGRVPGGSISTGRASQAGLAAAALVVLALGAWMAGYLPGAGDEPPRQVSSSGASAAPPQTARPGPRETRRGAEQDTVPAENTAATVSPPAEERPAAPVVDSARPAATMGRAEPSGITAAERLAPEVETGSSIAGAAQGRDASLRPMNAPREAPAEAAERRPAATRRAVAPLSDPLPAVNSILVAPERRLAVLDGAIVREGDAVGRRVLVRIEPRAVVLREPSGHEVRVPIRRRVGGPDGGSGS